MTDQYDINPNGHYMHRDWHAMYADLLSAYRAALARAEAAEALINEYHERTVAAEREASLCANALETARSRWAEAERREKSIFDDAMGIADQRDALVTRVAELEAAQQAAYNLGFADAAERFAGERVEPLIVSLEPQ